MKPPEDISEIAQALVAVPKAGFSRRILARMARDEAKFMSRDGSEETIMWIYNALEVTVIPKDDSSDDEAISDDV